MIFPKGGAEVEDTALFGKYRICRTIGRGRNGTVFLARHLALGEYRAIKRVQRSGQGEDSFLREAMILKSLRHPGIPVIYDLEQDLNYYYLIEEYLEGESLFALISRQGNLTKAKTISYGIELCRIMYYLHSVKPNPILYLDLQPKNLLICDGALKLIDFDQAVSAIFTGDTRKRYGTIGCAAPEQFTSEPMDARTDIYAIGALLHYMGTGTFPDGEERIFREKPDDGLYSVIRQCLSPSKEERYADAECVLNELLKLKPGVFAENQISLLKIAVVCSSHGMGATHVSLGLSTYLSGKGISNLYVERGKSGAVLKLAAYYGVHPDGNGIIHIRNLDLKPGYGACVKLAQPTQDVLIEDLEEDVETVCEEEGYQLILLLCGGKWWELYDSIRAARRLSKKENLRIVFNHIPPSMSIALPKDVAALSCHRMPFCPDPLEENNQINVFWEELFDGTQAGQTLFGKNKRNTIKERCMEIRKKSVQFLQKLIKIKTL